MKKKDIHNKKNDTFHLVKAGCIPCWC
jgi:hypothetical protein